MANWLESEENKKLIKDKERNLILETEQKVHNDLKGFYELCHRVNNVKPNSLEISRLKIMGTKRFEIESKYSDSGSLRSFTQGSRGLLFNCSNTEQLMIIVLIDEYFQANATYIPGVWIDNEYHEPISWEGGYSHSLKEILHKRFLLEDILNWTEKDMLTTIEYLLLETEYVGLPGKELAEEWKKDLIKKETLKLNKLQKDLKNANNSLSKMNEFQFGRSKYKKEEQIKSQNKIINQIKLDILNIQKELDILNSSILQ